MLLAVFAGLIIYVRAQVNGKSLLGAATHEEAVGLLSAAMNDLQLLVCLGPAVLMDMPSPLQSPLLSSQVSSGASGQVGLHFQQCCAYYLALVQQSLVCSVRIHWCLNLVA